jgi:hypothetical protein
MEFQGRKEANAEVPKGKSFLASAKHKHQSLFREYVGLQREFADLQEYTDALQTDAWELAEQIAKQSWRNGVVQGERRTRK